MEGRWVFHAEIAAREMQNVTLAEGVPLQGGRKGLSCCQA
jgi:hypothetical protein